MSRSHPSINNKKRRRTMKTKTIFKTLALAMLMPTMLLTTACSSDDNEIINGETANIQKGYPFPVTVNVTRQGDESTTRASYNESTRKLSFTAGDKLFVTGNHAEAGVFAGTLDYDAVSGKFSGTVTTKNEYTGTIDYLMASAYAVLLPAGYESYGFNSIVGNGYEATIRHYLHKAFALTKAAAVEQFSVERALSYSSGFALAPMNAIVNFTISGLTANKEVAVSFDTGMAGVISGNVTTNDTGVATFAVGVSPGYNLENGTLTVDGNNIALPTKTVVAGHIYNISRKPDLLSGVFSVSGSKTVKFSKGNLRYASGVWSFFDNQYDYYTSYSADAWDKFGWSTSETTYGMNTSTSISTYSGDFVDWDATIGTGWRTLTSDEWTYLFNTRSASTVGGTSNGRYAKAKVNNVQGIILFPDTYTRPDGVTAPTGVNATNNTGWNGNSYSSADWTKMESAGCVFLPAAGYRNGSSVDNPGTNGYYWSATPNDTGNAYGVYFLSGHLNPASSSNRSFGYSVRLVREVTE